MSYRREIVRPAVRSHRTVIKRKDYRYSTVERVETRTCWGWELSCGHFIYGEQGHGKTFKHCHYCEWADGNDPEFIRIAEQNKREWSPAAAEWRESSRLTGAE